MPAIVCYGQTDTMKTLFPYFVTKCTLYFIIYFTVSSMQHLHWSRNSR